MLSAQRNNSTGGLATAKANSDLLYHSGTGKVSIFKKQYDTSQQYPGSSVDNPLRKEVLNKIHEENNTDNNNSSIIGEDLLSDKLHHANSSPNFFTRDFMLKSSPAPKNHVRITNSNCHAIASLRNDIGVLKTTTMNIPVNDTQALLQLNF